MSDNDIRCTKCKRLVARRLAGGMLEVRRHKRLVAVVACGQVACQWCGTAVDVSVHETRLDSET